MPDSILDVPLDQVNALLDQLDPPRRKRKLSNAVAFELMCNVLKFGIPWSELRWRMGQTKASPSAVYKRFQTWVRTGVFDAVWRSVLGQYSHRHLLTDAHWFSIINVDTSMVKNVAGVDGTGPNPTDRARQATKISFICDQRMVPISRQLYPANRNDITTLEAAVRGIACPIHRDGRYTSVLAGDKGYVSKPIATILLAECRVKMLVPGRKNMRATRPFTGREKAILKQRHKIENTFARFDKFKRIYSRVDRLLLSYVAFTDIAMILVTLKAMPKAP